MVATVRAYGPDVLTAADTAGGDAEAALGCEVMSALFGAWRSAGSLHGVLAELAANPANIVALAKLSNLVCDVLDEDPELETALAQKLAASTGANSKRETPGRWRTWVTCCGF
jgi:hypothetical protein